MSSIKDHLVGITRDDGVEEFYLRKYVFGLGNDWYEIDGLLPNENKVVVVKPFNKVLELFKRLKFREAVSSLGFKNHGVSLKLKDGGTVSVKRIDEDVYELSEYGKVSMEMAITLLEKFRNDKVLSCKELEYDAV